MLYLAYVHADSFEDAVLANVNVGGENCHRGAALVSRRDAHAACDAVAGFGALAVCSTALTRACLRRFLARAESTASLRASVSV